MRFSGPFRAEKWVPTACAAFAEVRRSDSKDCSARRELELNGRAANCQSARQQRKTALTDCGRERQADNLIRSLLPPAS